LITIGIAADHLAAQSVLRVGDGPAFTDVTWEEWTDASLADPYVCEVTDCCDAYPSVPRDWVRTEYLGWWMKGNELPPLVTTSPPGTDRDDAGVLDPSLPTSVLFGGDAIGDQYRSGLRISLGHWLDDCQNLGVQLVYFSVFDDRSSADYFAQTQGPFGSGSPILARPFFDVINDAPNARLISFPNLVDGSVTVDSSSEMHSVALSLRRCFRSGSRGRVSLIGGYRYFRLREGLGIRERLVSTAPTGPIEQRTTFDVFDDFTAENDFHGGEIGVVAELGRGALGLELLAKVAVGNVHRHVEINGGTTETTPPPNSTTGSDPGGLLALPTNIGSFSANEFAALPEFGANLTFHYNDCAKVVVGYTLLMLNDVSRTGEQIDTSVNPTYLPNEVPQGPRRPRQLPGNVTDFWAQGFNIGLTLEH
jgi:hypothetical protein